MIMNLEDGLRNQAELDALANEKSNLVVGRVHVTNGGHDLTREQRETVLQHAASRGLSIAFQERYSVDVLVRGSGDATEVAEMLQALFTGEEFDATPVVEKPL
jgi:adenosine/AMP kinase